MATTEPTQFDRAQGAIRRAGQGGFRGDVRPATTFGQERIWAALLAVAEAGLAIADELRQSREMWQRGGDRPGRRFTPVGSDD